VFGYNVCVKKRQSSISGKDKTFPQSGKKWQKMEQSVEKCPIFVLYLATR